MFATRGSWHRYEQSDRTLLMDSASWPVRVREVRTDSLLKVPKARFGQETQSVTGYLLVVMALLPE